MDWPPGCEALQGAAGDPTRISADAALRGAPERSWRAPAERVFRAAAERALRAATLGPIGANPRVGAALIAPDGRLLAVGHHRGAGTPHAEADALARAREAGCDTTGATCLVTLEPCSHQGRTPSCAHALIDARVSRVLYAIADPNPRAAGGAVILRRAGIEACTWSEAREGFDAPSLTARAGELNRRWLIAQREQRPVVTAKIAQTLDGRVAAAEGTSHWITGPQARAAAHSMRSTVDAIIVGSGTLAADNPRLTARTSEETPADHQPLRVVIGQRAVPRDAAIRGTDGRFRHLRTRDLRAALHTLGHEDGVEHVLLEGGPTLIGAALAEDLVDDLWIHLAPSLLGEGTSAVPPLGITTLPHRLDFEIIPDSVHQEGTDLLFHAVPTNRSSIRSHTTSSLTSPGSPRGIAHR